MHDPATVGLILISLGLLGIVWQVVRVFLGMVTGRTSNRVPHTLLVAKRHVERTETYDWQGRRIGSAETLYEEANPNDYIELIEPRRPIEIGPPRKQLTKR